ncbi:expressed unknown protein [Seminavis robusta]|uniref:Uncharacterized protein n=1 Tax=Seminavis robusta TaxID=568900 RepID=A0A9N8E403_9STRA|nr:expressed unknown protein [Seminavis robusta]|eukprot:Sro631_g178440.1 n/a (714) ;mRNA; f:12869-15010
MPNALDIHDYCECFGAASFEGADDGPTKDAAKQLQIFLDTGQLKNLEDVHHDDSDSAYEGDETRFQCRYMEDERKYSIGNPDWQSVVCELVEKHAKLAQIGFHPKGKRYKWLPLMHLIYTGARKEVLKRVYNLFPDAIGKPVSVGKRRQIYPLTFACEHRSEEEDVICFLIKECTDLLGKLVEGKLPIHIAIEKKAPRRVIEYMLQKHPKCVLKQSYPKDCLSRACLTERPRVVKAVAKKLVTLGAQNWKCDNRIAMTLHDMHLLKLILEKVKKFTFVCDGKRVAERALKLLIDDHEGQKIQKQIKKSGVQLCKYGTADQGHNDRLEWLIMNQQSIQTVSMEWRSEVATVDVDGPVATNDSNIAVWNKISFNRQLGAISIACRGHGSTFDLANYLRRRFTQLSFRRIHLNPEVSFGAKQSQLKSLRLEDTTIPSRSLFKFLNFLADLPHLESLVFSFTKDQSMRAKVPKEDLTSLVSKLLGKQRLKSLEVTGLQVDVGRIGQLLRSNKSLTSLVSSEIEAKDQDVFVDLLKQHNSTLCRLECGDSELPFSQEALASINFFTTMNASGRSRVEDPNISIGTLVEILCAPLLRPADVASNPGNDDESDDDSDDEEDDEYDDDYNPQHNNEPDAWFRDPETNALNETNVTNMHYYLMRQCPHIFKGLRGVPERASRPRKRRLEQGDEEARPIDARLCRQKIVEDEVEVIDVIVIDD